MKQYRRVYIMAHGVKKRCRKEDRHYFRIKGQWQVELNEYDKNKLANLAGNFLGSVMKTWSKGTLHADFTESDGHGMESCLLYDSRNVQIPLVPDQALPGYAESQMGDEQFYE